MSNTIKICQIGRSWFQKNVYRKRIFNDWRPKGAKKYLLQPLAMQGILRFRTGATDHFDRRLYGHEEWTWGHDFKRRMKLPHWARQSFAIRQKN